MALKMLIKLHVEVTYLHHYQGKVYNVVLRGLLRIDSLTNIGFINNHEEQMRLKSSEFLLQH